MPSRGLDRFVRLRDKSCTGPGCSQSARVSDLDHRDPWPRGQTSADNLGPLSRRCHNAKTVGGWRLHRDRDGTSTWTSPLGRTYRRAAPWQPPPRVDLRRASSPAPPPADQPRRPITVHCGPELPLWTHDVAEKAVAPQAGAPADVPCPF